MKIDSFFVFLIVSLVGAFFISTVSCDDDDDDSDDSSSGDGSISGGALSCNSSTCTDLSSGLIWQKDIGCLCFWPDAIDYCKNLELDGSSDWRLPTISDLRSLIRGCPATESGGACEVTASCLEYDCNNSECFGCDDGYSCSDYSLGSYCPGELDCYNPGYCLAFFWSSSEITGSNDSAWGIDFFFARILVGFTTGAATGEYKGDGYEGYVRCVR